QGRGGVDETVTAGERALGQQCRIEQVLNMTAVVGMLVRQQQLGRGLDGPGFVAVHPCQLVRPLPALADEPESESPYARFLVVDSRPPGWPGIDPNACSGHLPHAAYLSTQDTACLPIRHDLIGEASPRRDREFRHAVHCPPL